MTKRVSVSHPVPQPLADLAALLAVGLFLLVSPAFAAEPKLTLKKGDHIAYIGNTLADRMQHDGWLETYIHAIHPEHDLTFRNLAVPGDELKLRPREDNFGSPDDWLGKVRADVVFCFFGYNEALKGEAALDTFRQDLRDVIDGMRQQTYDGKAAPELVFFSPIAHENLKNRHLPDGSANNRNLALYTHAMEEVCRSASVVFVNLFDPTQKLYQTADSPLTMNGIHLLPHGGRAVAEVVVKDLFAAASITKSEQELQRLRKAVLEKNYEWFSRYRVVDGYNVFGGRSKLAWFGQSNADVMMREMEIFDVKTANRDKRIWAIARGGDLEVRDDNLPDELAVQTNKPGDLADGSYTYLDGKEAIQKMTLAEGMQANLFADEKMFPELVNPVQMAVDPNGRLFVSVWPSYPHWNPTEPRRDRIICLPDDDGDGVADRCVIFADHLNSVTSFEFWNGGMIVAALPELWFLKDTDGDLKADYQVRILQGLSSADTHHSANAMVMGPDGWMYWSRGIFNVATMETPTRTYRSTQTGVHRFNPRTFEMEFHFPIGPNPHGDVFDRWGFQFANDGTSGTGSYVNIGKGQGNKQWFKKRVRPVAATGILSSSHFPEKNQGNFLICNAIGVLGVLQHEVKYNGADITCEEIEPILLSDDPNFRPTDLEIGGDGALYVSDWSNALIGHMQHNMRDPNRDHEHGRVYRVTAKNRPLVRQPELMGTPISEVCQTFLSPVNAFRYRARIELTGRDEADVVRDVSTFAESLDVKNPTDAQALLECLWVFEELRWPNASLLNTVVQADEPRVRSAAIRTLGHWGERVANWKDLLLSAARDNEPLVRAEAVKAAVTFGRPEAAEVVFEVATRPTDPELDTVLTYATGQLRVDQVVHNAIQAGQPLSAAAHAYALRNASVADLLKLERTVAVYEAVLNRQNIPVQSLREALDGLAALQKKDSVSLLLTLITDADATGRTSNLGNLGQLLTEAPAEALKDVRGQLEDLSIRGRNAATRRLGFAALMTADGTGANALFTASKSKESLHDLLAAVPSISKDDIRSKLYPSVRSLAFELPPNLKAEASGGSLLQPGIQVEYFQPSPNNVAVETLAKLKPQVTTVGPEIAFYVPKGKPADKFALRFTGMIGIPKSGKYTFFTQSDDGSRLYIGDQIVVNNDGLHGMVERSGMVDLPAGTYPITVTYFDNGGGDGLVVNWSGPGLARQKIGKNALFLPGNTETLHDIAIRSLASIPGHDDEKFVDLAKLVTAKRSRPAAIAVLRPIPENSWPKEGLDGLVDNLIGYLSEMPAQYRNSGPALDAVALVKALSTRLSPDRAEAVLARLDNLDVRVIAIGTVPAGMMYDKETIVVQAGRPVEFRFSNSDHMPHNFAIVEPGSLAESGQLAAETARDPDAKDRHYIPRSNKVLLASKLLEPGQSQALTYDVPNQPGVYPYVCSFPGHWRRMHGALYVVEDLQAYLANPEAYLAAHPLQIHDELLTFLSRNTEWKFDALSGPIAKLKHGRSFEVGRTLFRVANCVACHKLNGEGQELGPDLTKLDPKKHTTDHILRSILEPSKEIAEKYQSNVFVLASGKVVTGMVLEENDSEAKVLIDPLAKEAQLVVKKSTIDERVKSPTSIMPLGLLNKLTEEEILDLVAYVYAKGDQKSMLFHMHHNH